MTDRDVHYHHVHSVSARNRLPPAPAQDFTFAFPLQLLERTTVVQHRSAGRRRNRQSEARSEDSELSPLAQRQRRTLNSPSSKRQRRRRERAGHGSDSPVVLSSRVMSSSGDSRTSRQPTTCIDLTEDTLTTTPAVVDLTVTPTQSQRSERMRRDSSDVEITGETDLK